MDVEINNYHLIALVRDRPILWDKRCLGLLAYNGKYLTSKAWREVVTTLDQNFENRNENEKEEIRKLVARKWSNMKDSFVKWLRRQKINKERGTTFTAPRKYMYADRLDFLRGHVGTKDSDSSLSDQSHISHSASYNLKSENRMSYNTSDSLKDSGLSSSVSNSQKRASSLSSFVNDRLKGESSLSSSISNSLKRARSLSSPVSDSLKECSLSSSVNDRLEGESSLSSSVSDSLKESSLSSSVSDRLKPETDSSSSESFQFRGNGFNRIRRARKKQELGEFERRVLQVLEKKGDPNPLMSFFESLMPMLKHLNPQQTVYFQSGVLNLLQVMQNPILNNSFPVPSHLYSSNPYLQAYLQSYIHQLSAQPVQSTSASEVVNFNNSGISGHETTYRQ